MLLASSAGAFAIRNTADITDHVKLRVEQALERSVVVEIGIGSNLLKRWLQPGYSLEGDEHFTQRWFERGTGRRRVVLPVNVFRQDELYKKIYIPLHLVILAQVPLITQAAPAATPLPKLELSWVTRDISRLPPGVFLDIAELVGLETKYKINSGRVLQRGLTAPIPLIRAGDKVNMITHFGNLRVTARGEALEAGLLGATIRVRNSASGIPLEGIINDRYTVVISERSGR